MTQKADIGSEEFLIQTQEALDKTLKIISASLKDLANVKDDVSMAFMLMAEPIVDSSNTQLILSLAKKLRDTYAISRMIFDLTLSLGYFGVTGTDGVKKALQHYHQKAFRDLDRQIEIKGVGFGIGLKGINQIPVEGKLKEALDFYTTKKGFELRSWTGENVYKKIELIIDKYGNDLGFMLIINLFFIYRHSSEILHGTLFGSLFAKGMTKPEAEQPKSNEDLALFQTTYITFNLICSMLLNYVMFTIIHKHYPREKPHKEVSEILKDFRLVIEQP